MMKFRTREQVNKRLSDVVRNIVRNKLIAEDIAFHITDWKEDLEQLVEIYEREEDLSDEHIEQVVIRFLAHVPNHVAAAKKLIGLGPIEDVFNVNVMEED